MNIKEKYGNLCIILLSSITLGLISGAAHSLGIYYDVNIQGVVMATCIPASLLGTVGLIGITICLTEG